MKLKRSLYSCAILFCMLALLASGLCSTACSAKKADAIGYYDELSTGSDGKTVYNDNLFRINSLETIVADPFVLYVSDPASEDYGYFYLYGTTGNSVTLECYRSKTLDNWEFAGTAYMPDRGTDIGQVVADCFWAPEVVFGDDGYYYLFFTASRLGEDGERVKIHVPYVARAQHPAGPFEVVSNAENENRGGTPNTAYDTDKYCLFNNDEVARWCETMNITLTEGKDRRCAFIDLHPYRTANGEKYLYFKVEQNGYICGVRMKSWTEPDYSTFTVLTEPGKLTVGGQRNPMEAGTAVNEGPYVDEHNGKYYLTFSIYGYTDTRYGVCQAVADTPLGPYRKLTDAEGGLLLSADGGSMEGLYATGHHSFVEVAGKKYIIYHAFDNMACKGDRYACVDEIKWVTITDSTGVELDVMYCNGPTLSVMPRFDFLTGYTDLSPLATVSATGLAEWSDAKWLNDGLLTVNTITNPAFMEQYVGESTFDGDAKITLRFDGWKTVRAIMVYNSNNRDFAFDRVKSIVMTCALRDGTIFKTKIENLGFDWSRYSTYDGQGIRGGAAAIAEFDEMLVSEITVTVEKPEGNEGLAISEITVLGKNDASAAADSRDAYLDAYTFTPAENGQTCPDDGITVDGKLDEALWAGQNWQSFTYTSERFGRDYTLEMTSYFGRSGVYFAFRSNDPSLFYSSASNLNATSGIEFYLSAPGKTERHMNALEIDLSVSGRTGVRQFMFTSWSTYVRGQRTFFAVNVAGEINRTGGADGYTMEYYVPFANIGLSEVPEYVNSVPCLLVSDAANLRERWAFCAMQYGYTDRDGVYHACYEGYNANNPSTWMKWGKDGFIE